MDFGVVTGLRKMNMVNQVQILDKALCILHSANTLEKGMKLTILCLAMGK